MKNWAPLPASVASKPDGQSRDRSSSNSATRKTATNRLITGALATIGARGAKARTARGRMNSAAPRCARRAILPSVGASVCCMVSPLAYSACPTRPPKPAYFPTIDRRSTHIEGKCAYVEGNLYWALRPLLPSLQLRERLAQRVDLLSEVGQAACAQRCLRSRVFRIGLGDQLHDGGAR